MDENTMNIIAIVAFLGAVTLGVVAAAIAWAVVERGKERTKQLKLERQREDAGEES